MNVRRWRGSGLLVIPLLAVAVLALYWGGSMSQNTNAASAEAVRMDLSIESCTTVGATSPVKCAGNLNQKFTLQIEFTTIPSTGYEVMQIQIVIGGGLVYQPTASAADEFKFPGIFPLRSISGGNIGYADIYGTILVPAPIFTTGPALNLSFACDGAGTIALVPASGSNPAGSQYVDDNGESQIPPAVSLAVNCATPTSTPTDVPTPTPAATNTPNPTAVPTFTPTDAAAPTPTDTKTPGPTTKLTFTPMPSPIATLTFTPTSTPTATNTPSPTATRTFTPTDAPTPAPEGRVGDADCSGSVTSIDAALILQFNAGLFASISCEELADADGDGELTSIDALLILQFVAGLLESLPP